MSDGNEIKGRITVDAPGVEQTFKKVGQGAAAMSVSISKIASSTAPAAAGFTQLQKSVAAFGGGVNKFSQDITRLTSTFKNIPPAVDNASKSFAKLPRLSNAANLSLLNTGRILQDLPFGFIGVGNNINPLLESFQRLKAETGSTGGALKALAGSLMGAGGLGLAVSAVTGLLTFFALSNRGAKDDVEKTSKKVDEAKEKQKEFQNAISSASAAVIDQADRLSDLKGVILSTTTVIQDLTDATINQGLAEFIFSKKNEQVTKILNAEIQKQIKLRKEGNLLARIPMFNMQMISKDPLEREIGHAKGELGKLNVLGEGLKTVIAGIFDRKNTKPATDNALKGLLEDLKKWREEVNQLLSKPLDTISIHAAILIDEPDRVARKTNEAIDRLKAGDIKGIVVPLSFDPTKTPEIKGPRRESFDQLLEGLNISDQAKAGAEAINDTLTPAFEGLFESILKGEDPLRAFFGSIIQGIEQLISKLIAAAAQAAILSAISGGVAGGGLSFLGNFTKLLGGGAANLGSNIQGGSMAISVNLQGGLRVQGNDLVTSFNRTIQTRGRIG